MDAAGDETSPDQAAAQPESTEPAASHSGDPELAAFVRSVDQGQVETLPLMVLVGGMPFFGELVSGANWWEEMARLARGTAGDVNAQFADGADVISQLYREPDVERRPIGYLHMQNVVTDNRHLGLWRIRIEEVQGWHFGG
jgi:hypothetical protein